ncbi:MAG: PilN domain-containing protein, partial [Pseudomonadota bacterium]
RQDDVAKVDVELSIVLRSVADAALDGARAGGGRIYSLGVAGDAHRVELLPLSARSARRLSPLQKTNIALLSALGILIVIALATPIVIKRSEIKALAPLVDNARNEAEATRKVESEYQHLHQEYQVAVGKKYAAFQAVDIVEDLTKLLPDTTWLQNFEMKVVPGSTGSTKGTTTKLTIREIQIIGEAASASKMIELLEQSRLLQNSTQRAQTTRGAQPNTERFQIATEVKPRMAPEAIDLFAPPEKPAVLTPSTPQAAQTSAPAPAALPAPASPPALPATPRVTP